MVKINIKQSTLKDNHKAISKFETIDYSLIRGGWSNMCNGTGMLGNNVDYDDLIECPGCDACNSEYNLLDEDGENYL